MRKLSKRILAMALACTFSVSAAVCVAAEEIEMPDPIVVYDMEDESAFAKVVDGSEKPSIVEDYNEETKKGMGNVLKIPASSDASDSEVFFTNPFAGLDLSEGTQTADIRGDNYLADDEGMPIWYDGVIINYWIKTVDATNSVIMNFYNDDRLQYHKDDWRKHLLAVEAKEAYDAAAASGEPIDSRFALGETTVYLDENDKEYIVYNGGGEYMAYNPDYEEGYMLGSDITVYKKGDNPELESSWVTISTVGKDMYDAFYEVDFKVNPKSEVRQGYADGFLQFSLDGTIAFYEDDGTGSNINPNIVDAKGEFNIRNNLDIFGSTTLTEMLSAENDSMNWHMVTIVIQNDWIDYYIDGELFDAMADEFKWFQGGSFTLECADKSFNGGFGLRAPFSRGVAGRGDYLNGNRAGLLLTEWLSLDTTTFAIGGVVDVAVSEDREERVAEFYIDDVAFYDTLLDEDQIYELYTQGLVKIDNGGPVKGLCGDVNADEKVNATDALAMLQHAAKIATLDDATVAIGDTDGNGAVDATDALNVLKYAAGIISELPVK